MSEEQIYDEEVYRGFTIKIIGDFEPQNPREWDNIGTMVCVECRNHNLGDDHDMSNDEIKELSERKDIVSLPLYVFEHGGITIKTSPFECKWDSGGVGIVYVTYEKIKIEYGKVTEETKQKAIDCMHAEVETYNHYLSGNVYGFVIEDPDGEQADSCWGFYGTGEMERIMTECKETIDRELPKYEKRKEKEHKKAIDENADNIFCIIGSFLNRLEEGDFAITENKGLFIADQVRGRVARELSQLYDVQEKKNFATVTTTQVGE